MRYNIHESEMTIDELLFKADDILCDVSFRTPLKLHGWAKGISDRFNDRIGDFIGDFADEYNRTWNLMDKKLAEHDAKMARL